MSDYHGEAGWTQPSYEGAVTAPLDDQYLRRWTLSLGQLPNDNPYFFANPADIPGSQVEVISTSDTAEMDFRCTFKIRHCGFDTPGTAEITIYNLSNTTANRLIREYNTVQLQAGYIHGHYGLIFQGTIKQYKKGRESAVDSYLTLYAADGDAAFNNTFTAYHQEKGEKDDAWQTRAAADATARQGTVGDLQRGIGGTLPNPRGSVSWGYAMDQLREHQRTTGSVWSMQNGVLQNVRSTSYAQGDIVVINAGTGMVGVPEVTQDGIVVTTLLNPNYFIKQRVRLDNKELNQFFRPGDDPTQPNAFYSTYGGYTTGADLPKNWFASTNEDGDYAILVLDHQGDTRGLPWYSVINCLNIDPTAPPLNSVPGGQGYGMPVTFQWNDGGSSSGAPPGQPAPQVLTAPAALRRGVLGRR